MAKQLISNTAMSLLISSYFENEHSISLTITLIMKKQVKSVARFHIIRWGFGLLYETCMSQTLWFRAMNFIVHSSEWNRRRSHVHYEQEQITFNSHQIFATAVEHIPLLLYRDELTQSYIWILRRKGERIRHIWTTINFNGWMWLTIFDWNPAVALGMCFY